MLAVDRTNSRVADIFDGLHPAVLRALEITTKAGVNADIPVALCGEMAGDPLAAVLLVGLGFNELSMSSAALVSVKRALGAFHLRECKQLAAKALKSESGEQVLRWLATHLWESSYTYWYRPIYVSHLKWKSHEKNSVSSVAGRGFS